MPQKEPIEKDYYLPILNSLKSYGGSATLDEIRASVRPMLRASDSYLNADAGKDTGESHFEKDLNWAGKRLGDAGLIQKARTHWKLTEEGCFNYFTSKTLALLCELAGTRRKKTRRKSKR